MAQIISPNTQNGSVIVKAKLIPPQKGNSGKVLSTTGNALRWIAPSTVTPAALTKTDDTNVTLTLGGTPATSLLQAVSLTLGWTGTLADARIASAATWNAKMTNPMTTKGDIIYEDAVPAPNRLGIGSSGQLLTVDSTGLPIWKDAPIFGSLNYFWTTTASAVATYYKQLVTPFSPLTAFSTAGVVNGQLLRTYITDASNPNRSSIPAGEYVCHIHAAKTAGTKDAYLYAEIWETDSAGVDIAKIATLGVTTILTGLSAEYTIAYTSLQYTLASVNSRIATKVYATIIGGGSAPTIALYVGGISDSRTNLPASAIDIASYIPYVGALADLTTGFNINLSAETASTIASFDASKNIKSLDTATYPSLTELSYVKGVTSSIQTQLNSVVYEDPVILAYQALGSTIKANAVGLSFNRLTTAVTLADQNEMYVAVYLTKAQTITGVKWYQGSQGVYTANNYNGVGLYSYSGGTMTLVASSTDDGTIWKAAANTIQSKAFSSTYAAAAGIYFVGALWCRSAVTTAPSIYGAAATATLTAGAVDFTNSAKLYSTKAAGTSLPATRLQSATTGTNSQLFFALY